jgi:hypothetical protein
VMMPTGPPPAIRTGAVVIASSASTKEADDVDGRR